MASSKSYKEVRLLAGGVELHTIEYDFAKDGGAAAALDLMQVKEKCVLVDAWVEILTAFTSGGSATLIVGKTGDTDAIVPSTAVASLTANQVLTDAAAVKKFMAADDKILMTIGTAAMTAGRMRVCVLLKKFA